MKAVNVILSILILLLAAASAVFSYFLFEKRSQFVDGWAKMAVAINKSAVELDRDSGTSKKLADELTSSTLSHEQYTNLDQRLPKLAERARQVVTSRNVLASGLYTIANTVKAQKKPSEKDLCGLDTYEGKMNDVVSAVADTVNRRDRQFRNIANLSKKYLGVNLNTNELVSGNASALGNMEKALQAEKSRRGNYETALRTIAGRVGARLSTGSDYSKSTKNISDGVEKLYRVYRATDNDLKKTRAALRNAEGQLKKTQANVANLKNVNKKQLDQISDYKKALGIADADDVACWKDGSDDARKALAGKVLSVDKDYGYITVDLGKATRVLQAIGNKKVECDPQIVKGLELVIVDGNLADSAAKFVSRVIVDEVGEKCATANIPAGSKEIKVGQLVIWNPAAK